jgi:hypothetical protein
MHGRIERLLPGALSELAAEYDKSDQQKSISLTIDRPRSRSKDGSKTEKSPRNSRKSDERIKSSDSGSLSNNNNNNNNANEVSDAEIQALNLPAKGRKKKLSRSKTCIDIYLLFHSTKISFLISKLILVL